MPGEYVSTYSEVSLEREREREREREYMNIYAFG
jgi:hypothetical protein